MARSNLLNSVEYFGKDSRSVAKSGRVKRSVFFVETRSSSKEGGIVGHDNEAWSLLRSSL